MVEMTIVEPSYYPTGKGGTIVKPAPGSSEAYLLRQLATGFYHALGDQYREPEMYDRSEYDVGISYLGFQGKEGGGTWRWRPKGLHTIAEEDDIYKPEGLQFEGGQRFSTMGKESAESAMAQTTSWSTQGLQEETIKKSLLPQVAWGWRANLGRSLFGRTNREFPNLNEAAKSKVWSTLRGKWDDQNTGGDASVPEDWQWALQRDYMRMARNQGKLDNTRKAQELLRKLVDSAGINIGVSNMPLKAIMEGGEGGTVSPEEQALRLWPYAQQYITDTGQISNQDLVTALQAMDAAERKTSTFDIESQMAIWQDIEKVVQRNIEGNSFRLNNYVEITKSYARIAAKEKMGRSDLGIDTNREKLEQAMDDNITDYYITAFQGGGRLSYKEDDPSTHTYGAQSVRRYYDTLAGESDKSYTWIEPVRGGLGLYNIMVSDPVYVNGVVSNVDDLVHVNVSFIPGAAPIGEEIIGSIKGQAAYNKLEKTLNAVTNDLVWTVGGLQMRVHTTMKNYVLVKQLVGDPTRAGIGKFAGVYSSVMTVNEMSEKIFEWATGLTLALAGHGVNRKAAAAAGGELSGGFDTWANWAVGHIGGWGQRQAEKLMTPEYRSWVEDDSGDIGGLTQKRERENEDGEMEGGAYDSADSFTRKLSGAYPYQPKPFAWLSRYGAGGHIEELLKPGGRAGEHGYKHGWNRVK